MLAAPEELAKAQRLLNQAFAETEISIGCRLMLSVVMAVDSLARLPEEVQMEVAAECTRVAMKVADGGIVPALIRQWELHHGCLMASTKEKAAQNTRNHH